MLGAILYLVTAVATGAQVYWLLMWAIWGAPTSPTQYLSLCGSLVLLIAASLAKWKPRMAAVTALCAIAAIWCFYAPALVYSLVRLPYSALLLPSYFVALIPAVLLTASSYYAIAYLRQSKRIRSLRRT